MMRYVDILLGMMSDQLFFTSRGLSAVCVNNQAFWIPKYIAIDAKFVGSDYRSDHISSFRDPKFDLVATSMGLRHEIFDHHFA